MTKFSGVTFTYCSRFTTAAVTLTKSSLPQSIGFELTLCAQKRFVFFQLTPDLFIVLLEQRILLLNLHHTI